MSECSLWCCTCGGHGKGDSLSQGSGTAALLLPVQGLREENHAVPSVPCVPCVPSVPCVPRHRVPSVPCVPVCHCATPCRAVPRCATSLPSPGPQLPVSHTGIRVSHLRTKITPHHNPRRSPAPRSGRWGCWVCPKSHGLLRSRDGVRVPARPAGTGGAPPSCPAPGADVCVLVARRRNADGVTRKSNAGSSSPGVHAGRT